MSELNETSSLLICLFLYYGDTILLIEGVNKCLFIGTKVIKKSN